MVLRLSGKMLSILFVIFSIVELLSSVQMQHLVLKCYWFLHLLSVKCFLEVLSVKC